MLKVPARCMVTGGSGFVGQRLCEMLIERGAQHVVSFDIAGTPQFASQDPRIQYVKGDISKLDDLLKACQGIDCVFHIAAVVGPFHPPALYNKVNYEGTVNLIEACKRQGVTKIVCSGTPSTRMDGKDIAGKSEDQLPMPKPGNFVALYAETKAKGELALREATCDTLLSVIVAPHQVYGPRDALFLPNFMNAARTNRLRVFGEGKNLIDMTFVDNYCHGLILSTKVLYPKSPHLGKFYVVTDGEPQNSWETIDSACTAMGYKSIYSRAKLPTWFLYSLGALFEFIATLVSILQIAPRYKVLTALKVNTFTVKMMTIHRYFDISAAKRDFGYEPLVKFKDGWKLTLEWFKENWAPCHRTTEQIRSLGWK